MTEFGLGLQTNKPPGAYAPLARVAEEHGFAVVSPYNDLWFQPALPALLEIAHATSRVRVGPFADKAAAIAACDKLKSMGGTCLVTVP